MNSLSIYYQNDDFNLSASKLFGRVSANGNLLNNLVKHCKRKPLSVYSKTQEQYLDFISQFLTPNQIDPSLATHIFHGDIVGIQKSQLHFRGDPMISKTTWVREFLSSSAFSICGLTHSISSIDIAEEIGKLILAPTQPWDAIICTSQAVKKVMQELYAQWSSHLTHHKAFQPKLSIQLPVIPLGIDTDHLPTDDQTIQQKKRFREKYNIGNDDFVVLFLGRLFYYDKAHPIPMFITLQEFAKKAGKQAKIHFVQAGWFNQEEDYNQYLEAAKLFCPDVNYILITELQSADIKNEIWSGADVFLSLVDNIQESFGLTPIEAMSHGLPVIVSDWDGYKDTVRHGIDGFRIPTTVPPPGCGVDIAVGYLTNAVNYHNYCGSTAQMTAIDIQKASDALLQLFHSSELRNTMSSNGKQRARTTYSWQQIIKQYDELWDELTHRRLAAQNTKPSHHLQIPLLSDPFQTYASFASATLNPNHRVSLHPQGRERYIAIQQNKLASFGHQQRIPHTLILSMLDRLSDKNEEALQTIISHLLRLDHTISSGNIARTITYLIKYNILCLKGT